MTAVACVKQQRKKTQRSAAVHCAAQLPVAHQSPQPPRAQCDRQGQPNCPKRYTHAPPARSLSSATDQRAPCQFLLHRAGRTPRAQPEPSPDRSGAWSIPCKPGTSCTSPGPRRTIPQPLSILSLTTRATRANRSPLELRRPLPSPVVSIAVRTAAAAPLAPFNPSLNAALA